MSLTISLNPATLTALSEEASARNTTCEQVVREMVEGYFYKPANPNPEYDVWFRAKYEEGKAAHERGDVCSHEEVQRDMAERKKRYLARMRG